MNNQCQWKTTGVRLQHQVKASKTVPDLQSPLNKVKTTPRIKKSRIIWRAEQKLQEYVPSNSDERTHETIVNMLQYMSKEIVNSINLQHYQHAFQFNHAISFQELEFQLISSLEQLSKEIIEPLFQRESSNILGVDSDLNPYKKFNIKVIPKYVEIINGIIENLIKYLLPKNEKLSTCIEYLWKYSVLIIDLTMTFCLDRANNQITEKLQKLEKKLLKSKTEVKNFEMRTVKMTQEFETALMNEKKRYYELQGKYDQINGKVIELERLINEDIKTEGKDDSYKLKKNIKELDVNLKKLESQFQKQEEQLVVRLASVAAVTKSSKISVEQQLRQRLMINVGVQQPGDMVLSTLYTDHPWISIFCYRQLLNEYKEEPYIQEIDNKMEILHKTLMMEIVQQNTCNQLIENYKTFSDLYKMIITIIEPFEEATQAALQLNSICQIIFNFQGSETIEFYYINQVKQFYQELYYWLLKIQDQPSSPDQIEKQKEQQFLIDEEYKHKISKINLNLGRNVLQFSINQEFIKTKLSFLPIQTQLDLIFEQRSEITILHLLQIYITELSKQSKILFENKLMNVEITTFDEITNQICKEIFSEFKLNQQQIKKYIITRYFYLQEQQLKLKKEYIYRLEQSSQTINIDQESIINSIRQIRCILLFNPNLFSQTTQQHLKRIQSQEL